MSKDVQAEVTLQCNRGNSTVEHDIYGPWGLKISQASVFTIKISTLKEVFYARKW